METNKLILSRSLADIEETAIELLSGLDYPLVLFEGELGAGKTTLIKELGSYCFVEWPQLIRDYLEPPYHLIQIELSEDGHRLINLSSVS